MIPRTAAGNGVLQCDVLMAVCGCAEAQLRFAGVRPIQCNHSEGRGFADPETCRKGMSLGQVDGRPRMWLVRAGSRLLANRSARSAFPVLEPHLVPASTNTGEIASIPGTRVPFQALHPPASRETQGRLVPRLGRCTRDSARPCDEHAPRPTRRSVSCNTRPCTPRMGVRHGFSTSGGDEPPSC